VQGKSLAKRKSCAGGYRYGFNGKENDGEVSGEGNQYDYGFRIYNPRLGKFLSVDPLTKSYPMLTPYQFASNKPINCIDLDGLESADAYHYLDMDGKLTGTPEIRIREKNGILGDGIMNHQLIMTSDNPNGMIQNFEYKEDFNKASYNPSTEIVANSNKTERAHQEALETTYPIIKIAKMAKNTLKEVDVKMQGSNDGANMGTVNKRDIKVATGVIGTMTGAGGLVSASSAVAYTFGILGLVNDADDIYAATNAEGQSFLESRDQTKQSRDIVSGIKSIMNVLTFSQGMMDMPDQIQDALHVAGTASDAVGVGQDLTEPAVPNENK
jgi:RHS repeat-associated protein